MCSCSRRVHGCSVSRGPGRAALCARGRRPVATAGLLCVPVGGGPPARSPHASRRLGVIDLEARPGPATAHGHRSQASLAPCVAPAHRWSSRWTCEPVGEPASVQLVVGQNVPGRGTSGHVRDKIRPARPKAWNLGCFARAGRVLSRFGCGHVEQGEFCPGLSLA